MLFTSEQVSAGHPDKVCDQISDAVLDYCLTRDPNSRVACEAFGKGYNIIVGGEITTNAEIIPTVTVTAIVRDVLTKIGVPDVELYKVTDLLDAQSADIAMGVDTGGAGDQGIMFGYACDETEECMPLAWVIANEALEKLKQSKSGILLPDAKSQVTLRYDSSSSMMNPAIGKAVEIETFLISTQHIPDATQTDIYAEVETIMQEVANHYCLDIRRTLVNPTGRFAIGGFIGDAGLTGRKIIADTYGGYARHGGGAFSGKDATKVDRSAAYMARWVAKSVIHMKLARTCEVQLAYAIGVKQPVSLAINTFGTGVIPEDVIARMFSNFVDMSPNGIIERFGLKRPIFSKTASYGHFGKAEMPWERLTEKLF